MEKMFWLTENRERDILRYSKASDQKDAKPRTFAEAHSALCGRNPAYAEVLSGGKTRGQKFLESAMSSIYNDWVIYASR